MIRVLLLQLDGKIPNIALMRIAAHHRDLGDAVELRHVKRPEGVEREFWDRPDKVYASCIFEKTRPVAERVQQIYPAALIGGTGWAPRVRLEDHGITTTRQDYSLWPGWRQSIGFTHRGCRFKCPFCKVPVAEGPIREYQSVLDLWRGDPWPKELILLDNDFFGSDWRPKIKALRDGGFKVSFNQGINARTLSDEAAEAIASVRYQNDEMERPRIYTAWDNRGDEGPLFRGLRALVRYGVRPDNIMVYMLIGYWADETEEDWLDRQQKLKDFGARPYPMPYVRNDLTRGFQRWCTRRGSFKVSWQEYKAANCRPEKVEARRALTMFDVEASGASSM